MLKVRHTGPAEAGYPATAIPGRILFITDKIRPESIDFETGSYKVILATAAG